MEVAQKKVEEAVNSMLNEIDSSHLRNLQVSVLCNRYSSLISPYNHVGFSQEFIAQTLLLHGFMLISVSVV